MPRPVLQYSKLPFNEQSICRSPFSLVCSPPDDSSKGFPAEQTFLVFPLASPCPIRTHPSPDLRWGKNLSRRWACGLLRLSQNFFTPGGRVRKDPRAGLRYAPAPKAAADLPVTGAAFVHEFATVPAQSFGYGRSGTGFPNCSGRRRPPSLPCGP